MLSGVVMAGSEKVLIALERMANNFVATLKPTASQKEGGGRCCSGVRVDGTQTAAGL